MYQKVKAYVEKHHMLQQKDKILVGVSGGADSICLLFMLLELKKDMELTIEAVHVNHGLRGVAADADEQFVRDLCAAQGVRLHVFHEDVKTYAEIHKCSEEEAGREIRRCCFLKVMEEEGADKIALGHHKNDNVETFLWNVVRGTDLRGAGGIRPVTGEWIRPLLGCSRAEIESYLKKRELSYCTDETNLEDIYTRNKIRNRLIPYMEQELHEKSVEHIAKMMEQFQLAEAYLEKETDKFYKECVEKDAEQLLVKAELLTKVPEVFRSRILYRAICEMSGYKKDIEQIHVQMVEGLLEKQVGKRCELPYGLWAFRNYDGVLFFREGMKKAEQEVHMKMRVFPKPSGTITFPENPYTKWFDYDIIKGTVKLRHREAGDYLTINRAGGTKKLKQYFVDEKIPQQERDNIWLVADDSHIMWVVGYRQNQFYQITEKTRNILEVEMNGGESWQRQ